MRSRTCSGVILFLRAHAYPVKNLLDYLAAGDSLNRFLDHFPSVTREQAVAALEVAKDHTDFSCDSSSMSRCRGRCGPLLTGRDVRTLSKWVGPV